MGALLDAGLLALIFIGWALFQVAELFARFREWRLTRRVSLPEAQPTRSAMTLSQGVYTAMKRGVGYCENTDCEDYAKGIFLLNHGDTFHCPRCARLGHTEKEQGIHTGDSDIFKEVRVEYNFDPINRVYREIAIIRDESLWGRNNTYTMQSPLIKTERRALKVGEAILSNLNRYRGLLVDGEIPRAVEHVISFDDSLPELSRKLGELAEQWKSAEVGSGHRTTEV